jgi:diadenylate cyclase
VSNVLSTIQSQFGNINLSDHPFFVIDIFLVAIAFYYLYIWSRNTRVIPVITGLILLGLSFLVSRLLNLQALEWVLDKFLTMMIVAIPIVFSDELKRMLEKIGNNTFFKTKKEIISSNFWIDELVHFALLMKQKKLGALIVIEKSTLLTDYIEDGNQIDANISTELLLSIFHPSSPLHDGAVIIRNGKIASSGCILPVAREIIPGVGTRHHAGLSISNKSDAIAIINSEERGEISLAQNNFLKRNIDEHELKYILINEFSRNQNKETTLLHKIKSLFKC